MMKKTLVAVTVIVALTAFGTVSSARAFIDPATLTVVLGTVFILVMTGADALHDDNADTPENVPVTVDTHTIEKNEHQAAKSAPDL